VFSYHLSISKTYSALKLPRRGAESATLPPQIRGALAYPVGALIVPIADDKANAS
jgi:hypothetical protein